MPSSSSGTDASYYVTTAISYPNGRPHIGHAYEYVTADVLARFHRLAGRDVYFQTGTDEHGQKMMKTAEAEGITPKELADINSERFRALHDALGTSYDRFIRTTDPDHYMASQAIWEKMAAAGDIYLGQFSGWYSVRDEAYFTESELKDGPGGTKVAISTDNPVEWTEEESYFFKLSRYQQPLLDYIDANPEFLGPDTRRNEIVSFIKSGLRDLSISRNTFDWGVPVPGDPSHVMYVWVDALTNYLTGAGYPDTGSERFNRYWPANLHYIGKDIIRFHAVYWPAFLMSAGIELPRSVFAHGFILNDGTKMSKSLGNTVDPEDLIASVGADRLRYFLTREFSNGQDGSYTAESMLARLNADLANGFGNLTKRTLTMIEKNLDGVIPVPGELSSADLELLALADGALPTASGHIETLSVHRYAGSLWEVLAAADRYISSQEPWALKKTDPGRMKTVLYVAAEVVRVVTILAQPIMPTSTSTILDQLGQPQQLRDFAATAMRLEPGQNVGPSTVVFPRLEVASD